jgi:hypothetical protein
MPRPAITSPQNSTASTRVTSATVPDHSMFRSGSRRDASASDDQGLCRRPAGSSSLAVVSKGE